MGAMKFGAVKIGAVKLVAAEIRFRQLNFALSVLAVIAATTLFAAAPLLVEGYSRQTQSQLVRMAERSQAAIDAKEKELASLEDETRKLMLTMGFNLIIVHQDTNMADFWADDFAARDMPQDYVAKLAKSKELEHVRHLVATLQGKIKWRERNVMLIGYMKETPQTWFKDKKPMGHVIQPGTIYLGYELWSGPKIQEGDQVEVLGQTFQVAKKIPEKGSKEDIAISMNLTDAQKLLQKEGQINQILAIGCQCEGDRLGTIRKELERTLPETKVTEHQTIAQARAEQRDLVAASRLELVQQAKAQQAEFLRARAAIQSQWQRLTSVATPLVIVVCGLWLGLLALGNVRERRPEIGLLRAIGKTSLFIAGLFLGRAVLVGVLGAAAGCLLGILLARQLGAGFFDAVSDGGAAMSSVPAWLWLSCLAGAPLMCALASYVPTLRAVAQDPAVVLRDV